MSGQTITLAGALGATSATLGVDVLQIGTAPLASAGLIRLPSNATDIAARNAANGADVALVATDGSDNVLLGDGTNAAGITVQSAGSALVKVGATTKLTIAASLLTSASALAIGATVAAAGSIRLPTTVTAVAARNAANAADIAVLATDGSDNLALGDGTNAAAVNIASAGTTTIKTGATAKLTVATSLLTSASPIAIGASVSTTGSLRVPTAVTALAGRNNAGAADIALVATDASDNVSIGDGTNGGTNLNLTSKTAVNLVVGATTRAALTATALTLTLPALTFEATQTAPTISQAATGGASGQAVIVQGQNAVTTGGVAGLTSGTGTTAGNVVLTVASTGSSAAKVSMTFGGVGERFSLTGSGVCTITADTTVSGNVTAVNVTGTGTGALKSGTAQQFKVDGTGVGFFQAATAARPAAYTLTYNTGTRTNSNLTAAAVATTAAALASYGFSQAQADSIPVAINALVADMLNVKQFMTQHLKDIQGFGLLQ